ncbi:MAG: 2-octaprenyl-6-methoxyphenyl hydroxylase [Methylococcaceae bacterium]|nr:2-octaprenyl-6-methoxyphenyl hydroxylase [Methylococcaceae bacterium]
MQVDYDVIIIGAGLAGGCLALALAATDLRIAVVEANAREQRYASPAGDRALALAGGTITLLDNLGIWEAIKPQATPIAHIHVSDQGHFGKTRLSAEREGVPALGYVITARSIEDHIANLLAQSPNITQFCPARIIGISSSTQEASVSLKQADQASVINARLVVGADGGQSSVRKLLEIGQNITDYGQTALVTTVKTTKAHANTAYERFTAAGPLALLPTTNGQSSVVWTRSTEQAAALMAGSEADFMAQLQSCFGYRLGELTLTAPRRAFPLSLIRAKHMQVGRVIIIGNAVHQLHPVAGQGFNLGLRDVIVLAEQLIQQHTAGLDIGENGFLHAYVQKRLKDHNRVIGFTDGLIKLFSNQSNILAIARNTGLTFLDHLPGAKSYLARRAMGLSVDY